MKRYCAILTATVFLVILFAAFEARAADESSGSSVVEVSIKDMAFSPEAVTVKVGTEVVWKNKDSLIHTVKSEDGGIDSGPLSEDGEYRKKFTKTGTFSYSCEMHPFMTGSVEVK